MTLNLTLTYLIYFQIENKEAVVGIQTELLLLTRAEAMKAMTVKSLDRIAKKAMDNWVDNIPFCVNIHFYRYYRQ